MRIIGVISGKGGVGKTTTVANLSSALALLNKKVLAVDGNLIAPNLGIHFGIYHYSKTLLDVLKGEAAPDQVIQSHPSGVHLIPSVASSYSLRATSSSLLGIFKPLEEYDFILLDTAPGVEREIFPVLQISDEVIIITNPEYPSVIDAKRTVEVAKESGILIRGIELNRVKRESQELSPEDIQYVCELPVVSLIPERKEIRRSIASGVPAVVKYPDSPASIEFKRLAGWLIGEEYEIGFLQKFRSFFWFRWRAKLEEVLKKKAPPIPVPPPREIIEIRKPRPEVIPEKPEVIPEKKPEKKPIKRKRIEKKVEVPKPKVEVRPEVEMEVKAEPAKPKISDEERRKLEKSRKEIETLLTNLKRQREKGILPERTYKKLKEKNEEILRGIIEKLENI
jgi:septum site-determining protein MinD